MSSHFIPSDKLAQSTGIISDMNKITGLFYGLSDVAFIWEERDLIAALGLTGEKLQVLPPLIFMGYVGTLSEQ